MIWAMSWRWLNYHICILSLYRGVFGKRSTPAVSANIWTHVAGTFDSATNEVNIYVNGTRLTTFNRFDPTQDNLLSNDWSELAVIGRLDYGTVRSTRHLEGSMDEFYVYPCALSAKQILELKERKCTESKLFLMSMWFHLCCHFGN